MIVGEKPSCKVVKKNCVCLGSYVGLAAIVWRLTQFLEFYIKIDIIGKGFIK